MQKYQNSLTNSSGQSIVGARVLVTTLAGATAVIYSDNGVTRRANPIVVDGPQGEFSFYAANARYTLTTTGANIAPDITSDIILYDPSDGLPDYSAPGGAALVGFATTDGIVATTVQAAIEEVVTDLATTVGGVVTNLAASGGAGVVGFSHAQTYATGTLGSKAKQIISVTDAPYNAVGDGVTDDTAAIQAAASLGRAIYLPEGVYKTTGPIACVAGTSFYGDGPENSSIYGAHSGRMLSFEDVSTYGVFIRDIEIRGNGSSTGLYAASTLEQSSHMHLSNVRIYNHAYGTDGIDTFALFDSYLEKVDFIQCSGHGLQLAGSQNTLIGCTFRNCRWGILESSTSGFSVGGASLVGGVFVGNTFDVVIGSNTVRPMRFTDVWFEQTGGLTVGKVTAGEVMFASMVFRGCLFQPAAGATGNGVIDTFDFKGTVAFENCAVYGDLYASASLPGHSNVAGDTNISYRRLGCFKVDAVGVVTAFEDVIHGSGFRAALSTFTVATLPIAANTAGQMIYVSNEAGGAVPAFSDGANWRRVTDRAIVS